jgi:hypothetical protein
MDVRLHIERLRLDGLSITPAERAGLVDALQTELSRLIARDGISDAMAAGLSVPVLDGGTLVVPSPFDPAAFGRALACSLCAGIGRPAP